MLSGLKCCNPIRFIVRNCQCTFPVFATVQLFNQVAFDGHRPIRSQHVIDCCVKLSCAHLLRQLAYGAHNSKYEFVRASLKLNR